MAENTKVKIIVLGPTKTGKSTIGNFLCGLSRNPKQVAYHPTVGVRVLEFERNIERPKKTTINVELWDCSGDRKYEYGWPAIMKDTQGIIYVFDPQARNQDKDLENWYNKFSPGLRDSQMLILAHNSTGEQKEKFKGRLGKNLARVALESSSIEFEAETITKEFDGLLARIATALFERRYQEEQNILNNNDSFQYV